MVSDVRRDAGDRRVGFEMGGVEKVLGYVMSELEMLGVQGEGGEVGEEPRKGLMVTEKNDSALCSSTEDTEMDEQVSTMAMDVDDVDSLEIFAKGVIAADHKLADVDFFNNLQDDFDDLDFFFHK
ncbi:unnamed protein product [Sphenostylis stenocarpa]|uniref:Uncharacterized protein n=1 Tax=Sphenostylis stenocarpa TaxID=92480 RepID=A0AA86V9Y5_9FABA|nr:unnamed protein product [Sphenostylis stenocarpa]